MPYGAHDGDGLQGPLLVADGKAMAAVLALDHTNLCVRCGRLRSLLCTVYQAFDLELIGV